MPYPQIRENHRSPMPKKSITAYYLEGNYFCIRYKGGQNVEVEGISDGNVPLLSLATGETVHKEGNWQTFINSGGKIKWIDKDGILWTCVTLYIKMKLFAVAVVKHRVNRTQCLRRFRGNSGDFPQRFLHECPRLIDSRQRIISECSVQCSDWLREVLAIF